MHKTLHHIQKGVRPKQWRMGSFSGSIAIKTYTWRYFIKKKKSRTDPKVSSLMQAQLVWMNGNAPQSLHRLWEPRDAAPPNTFTGLTIWCALHSNTAHLQFQLTRLCFSFFKNVVDFGGKSYLIHSNCVSFKCPNRVGLIVFKMQQ